MTDIYAPKKAMTIMCTMLLTFLAANNAYASDTLVVKVQANELNVRDAPTRSGNIIGSLQDGDVVIATNQTDHGWTAILFEDRGGFVASNYVEVVHIVRSNDTGLSELKGMPECKGKREELELDVMITASAHKIQYSTVSSLARRCSTSEFLLSAKEP